MSSSDHEQILPNDILSIDERQAIITGTTKLIQEFWDTAVSHRCPAFHVRKEPLRFAEGWREVMLANQSTRKGFGEKEWGKREKEAWRGRESYGALYAGWMDGWNGMDGMDGRREREGWSPKR